MADKGTLYVVATPIGNLGDCSARALVTLGEVDVIACEDQQRTTNLLRKLGSSADSRKLVTLNAGNEDRVNDFLISRLDEGSNVALVSDAGTPLLSDPGFPLISAAHMNDIKVVPIPGPSAIMATLSVCPVPLSEFKFVGFLPRKIRDKKERLFELAHERVTVVFFESPRRILNTLELMSSQGLGGRMIFVARELTKLHEEMMYDTVDQIQLQLNQHETIRGEFVVVLARDEASQFYELDELVTVFKQEGIPPSQGARLLARICSVTRKEAYRRYIAKPSDDD